MITLYKSGSRSGVEVPCGWLRKFLYDTNPDNINTGIMLDGKTCLLKDFFPDLRAGQKE